MPFDFGALSPEINSTRMYTGPGAAPLMAAAAAYSNLAAELSSTATAAESVISTLTEDEWRGPSSATMATAAAPYVQWLLTTSASLQHAADQAMASAAAYEAAYAMTVPPAVVAANRAQLATLVATNIVGQNTPAIAANEALYGEMWAQDAAAMYGYAGSSALAGRLDPLTAPTPAANPAPSATADQAAGTSTGLSALVSSTPSVVQSLANPAAAAPASAVGDFFSDSLVQNIPNGIIDMAAWNGFNAIVTAVLYSHTFDAGLIASQFPPDLGAIGIGPAQMAAGLGSGGASAASVSAAAGQATTVGKLSVPASWSAATPATMAASTAPLAGSGWTVPAEQGAGVMNVATGMPAYASAGRGGYGVGPRYGIQPTVMPRQVLV